MPLLLRLWGVPCLANCLQDGLIFWSLFTCRKRMEKLISFLCTSNFKCQRMFIVHNIKFKLKAFYSYLDYYINKIFLNICWILDFPRKQPKKTILNKTSRSKGKAGNNNIGYLATTSLENFSLVGCVTSMDELEIPYQSL